MISVKEIYWLAGLIEGEGNIAHRNSPRIIIKMTDKDVIDKVASLWKRPVLEELKDTGFKRCYTVSLHGTPAIEWIFTIYSILGERRKEKSLEVINIWKSQKSYNGRNFPCGHPRTDFNSYHCGKYKNCRQCRLLCNAKYRRLKVKSDGGQKNISSRFTNS